MAKANKLPPKQVQQIRDAVRIGWSQRAVAAHHGISQATVSDIVTGAIWADIPDEPASVLRPVDPRRVESLARAHGGRLGGPTGVVHLEPHAEDEPPPRAA